MTSRNDPCWCGSGQKFKKCHYPNPGPQSITTQYFKQYGILIKTPEQITGIKAACTLAKNILAELCDMAKAGVTTLEINNHAEKLVKEAGAVAASLGYGEPPFPKSICTSLNEVICHGIPDNRPLQNGDILNIDISPILNGYYGDCSRMVMIGNVSPEKKHVVDVAYQCLVRSCAILKPGVLVSQIGQTIEDYADSKGCSTVYQFVAHGVGVDFHEAPQIPHTRNQLAIPLVPGMTFTIEPMINIGVPEAVIDRHDKWTARTKDGKPSAQWEHTILITETGHEILTAF